MPISATSGTSPPAIAVVNLSCACAHGTNSIFTVVPGLAAWKSVAYLLTTFCTAGEPGSMIQTSDRARQLARRRVIAALRCVVIPAAAAPRQPSPRQSRPRPSTCVSSSPSTSSVPSWMGCLVRRPLQRTARLIRVGSPGAPFNEGRPAAHICAVVHTTATTGPAVGRSQVRKILLSGKWSRPLWRCRRKREHQRLAVTAGSQRVGGADRLLELDRHGLVAGRGGPGLDRRGQRLTGGLQRLRQCERPVDQLARVDRAGVGHAQRRVARAGDDRGGLGRAV